MTQPKIRCGDTVLNKPSGEKWLVAYADYESGYLSWFGWPEGKSLIEECELVRSCSDERHIKAVREWITGDGHRRRSGNEDHRVRVVRRLYGHVLYQGVHGMGRDLSQRLNKVARRDPIVGQAMGMFQAGHATMPEALVTAIEFLSERNEALCGAYLEIQRSSRPLVMFKAET